MIDKIPETCSECGTKLVAAVIALSMRKTYAFVNGFGCPKCEGLEK